MRTQADLWLGTTRGRSAVRTQAPWNSRTLEPIGVKMPCTADLSTALASNAERKDGHKRAWTEIMQPGGERRSVYNGASQDLSSGLRLVAQMRSPRSLRLTFPALSSSCNCPFNLIVFSGVSSTGRSLRTCFLCLFVWCFFWTENLVFSRVRSLSKQSVFRKCFFAENLGEEGEEFWDALLLRGGLNLTCVAAWPKGPQRRKSRGKGRDPLGQKHAAGELGSLLVTIVGHLSSR